MKKILKSVLKKEYLLVLSVILSLTMIIPSFFTFSNLSAYNNVNHYKMPILYFYLSGMLLSVIIFFILRFINIKYFFDEYIFSGTIIILSIFAVSFSYFSTTNFYFFYSLAFVLLSIIFLIISIRPPA